MAMPTSAPAIAPIFEVTNEMTLTANPMIDNTTATYQVHLFALNRPYATISDAIQEVSIMLLMLLKLTHFPVQLLFAH
jgi:hypothetical protein